MTINWIVWELYNRTAPLACENYYTEGVVTGGQCNQRQQTRVLPLLQNTAVYIDTHVCRTSIDRRCPVHVRGNALIGSGDTQRTKNSGHCDRCHFVTCDRQAAAAGSVAGAWCSRLPPDEARCWCSLTQSNSIVVFAQRLVLSSQWQRLACDVTPARRIEAQKTTNEAR